MTKEQWLSDIEYRSKPVFKISWTKQFRAIQRANKQYPYKLWMGYNNDPQPMWYRIDNEQDEQLIIKHLSHTLRYAEELYVDGL